MAGDERGYSLGLGRVSVLAIVLFLVVRLFLMWADARPGRTVDAAAEAPAGELARAGRPTLHFQRELLRLHWDPHCPASERPIRLYAASDAACQPWMAETVAWLRGELVGLTVLAETEALSLLQVHERPACGAAILEAGRLTGWLCADLRGLYRTNAWGEELRPGRRWQLWSTGGWAELG